MIGKVVKDNYRIVDEMGRGSVATVYLAKDMARNQVIALKIIHPEQAAEGQFLQRFQREARLLQMLSSPQAVKVFDYGEDAGLNFIALEYVQGRTLASILEEEGPVLSPALSRSPERSEGAVEGEVEGPLEVNRALDIARQVALCLVDAHAKSVVHRDLRPANIMVTDEGTVKVMDFGIAWGADLTRQTATGVLSSPHYLSPEQVEGKEVDGRSDIYSLGVTLFEMLSGKRPYDADSAVDIVLAHLHEPIPSLHQLDERIPLEVDELVRKCLAKKPEDRYQSAAEFLEAIDETLRATASRKEGVVMGMEAGLAGQTLGAYRIVEQIGRGGMATVYKAYEPALDRYVAIKVLPQYFAHDPDFAARFEREAKAVAKLDHPNILPIYSFGQEAGLSYIAMRYVEAGTLKEMLGKPLDLKVTADILGQIGRALDYAHQRGVVHRDVKPTNVLMAEGQWALLTDFGLARMVESSVQLTKSGVGVGTPAYMSPEQGQGVRVDARSDVYSLGVVLYEMVTGRVPYEAETPMAVVLKHITAPLPLPREVNPDLPESVERVILKAMAKAPEDRYQTVGGMIEALERVVAGLPAVEKPPEIKPVPVEAVPSTAIAEPTPAPAVTVPVEAPPVARKGLPAWVWGVVGAVVLLIAAGGVFLATWGEKPSPTPEATAVLAATPAPPVDIDPTVYDNFNNAANEGGYDKDLWELRADPAQVAQRDGAMVFTQQGKPHEGAGLAAYKYYEISLDRPTFFEARLMLSPDANAGNVQLHLHAELSPDEIWYAECNIVNNEEGEAMAGCFDEVIYHGQVDSTHGSEPIPVPFGSWHTVRMEVDPATMTFSYFVDGQLVGSHIPSDADRLKQARFTLSIGIYTPTTDALTGYVDDVRVGPLETLTAAPVPPSPLKPVSPGVPPVDAIGIKPCQWDDLGPGLCISPLRGGTPTKILEDTELEIPGPPSWGPDGQQITFSALGPGESPDRDTSIYIVNADGSGLTELPSVGNDITPAWSPDGEWLAFHSSCNLAIMHPDGSAPTVIWNSEGRTCTFEPQWSPDSQWIVVFMQMEGGGEWTFPMRRELWVISRDGATVTPVATTTHEDDSCLRPDVAFSPDGKQVAYFDADCQPWLVNADGSGQAVPLTDFPGWWPSMVYPQWGVEKGAPIPAPEPISPGSPPMDAIEVKPCQWDDRGPGLCIFPLRGGEPTRILKDVELELRAEKPSWSPDGRRIAFSAIKPGGDPGQDSTIYIVNADGSGLTELPSVGNDVRPAWSPDGEWLAFHSSGDLAIMRPDGSDPAVIWHSDEGGCTDHPEWSPDSQWVAVFTDKCEWIFPMTRELRVISRDGSAVTTVATVTYEDDRCVQSEVAFSPDGRQVAYFDEDCRPWMVKADGSGQAMFLEGFPFWWTSMVHPQWGGKQGAPPPKPIPPTQLEEGKIVERCEDVTPPQICIRDAQTDQVVQVTNNLEFGDIEHQLAWSPDGQQFIFGAGSDFEVTQRHDHKLYVLNADGSGLRQITSGDTNDMFPAWSPDGQWIAFHRSCDLWIIRPDGSDGQSLLAGSDEFCASNIAWSPDSQRIAFPNTFGPGEETAHWEAWVVNRDGTNARMVYPFEQPLRWMEAAWSPDGRQIACWYNEGGKMKGLLVNADGSGEPKMIDEMPWSWLPNFWPQWGGEKRPPPPSAPEAAPVPADPWGQVVVPPGGTIHIGLVADFSGQVGWLGPAQENAVQMAVEDQGPVKSFPMSIIVTDGGCNNEMGAAAAQTMVADPSIVGVIGHTCSASCVEGAPVYEGAHLTMISPSCTSPDLSRPGYQIFNRVMVRDDQGGDERNLQPVNTDIYQDFAHRYQSRYGQSLLDEEWGVIAAYAYDAASILTKAIELVSVVDEAGNLVIGRQALANAVRATPGHPGVTGVIGFDDRGDRLP